MTSATDIRSHFLNYFKNNGHSEIQSAPLVPDNDPTLLFINSGMVQFKNIFTGKETRSYKKAVTAQKCVRAGGKHNDLENVGYTARHHTFFEMLGNFSFGDYFKEQAIEYAWSMVHHELGLPKDKLLVTVYADDDEAASLWRKIAGFSDDKIIRIGTSDNFWQMGDTGPCGPCSEIFYDHGDSIFGGPPGSADEDGDRFIEIWNLVFMQYEQSEGGVRVSLPSPCVDTGMGLERISAVMQGKHNNYDIDLLRSIIEEISDLTGVDADGEFVASHRVIADHLRSASFLVADGVLPSNEGRGYVLRRIMRRGMRHAHMLGGVSGEPLMYRLVDRLVDLMGGHFTELQRAKLLITETLRSEEVRFHTLLERGLRLLDKESSSLGDGGTLSGSVAFTLYDTYGFPLDLTQDILRGRSLLVDVEGFESCMESQRSQARRAWVGSGGSSTDKVWFDLRGEFGASEFLGYTVFRAEAVVLALVVGGERVDSVGSVESVEGGIEVEVILSQTPFYGESGGQQGDRGDIRGISSIFAVRDTQLREGMHVHIGELSSGILSVGDEVESGIDVVRRMSLRSNHSVTHLLHGSLRRLLGEQVVQKGSLVGEDILRFDFSHGRALSGAELSEIECIVNDQIRSNDLVETSFMTPAVAIEAGALALFGEKYGDEVRVVSMGERVAGGVFSTELCGGTHVERTGDIGYFRILSESAVSSGVRRITASTGSHAVKSGRNDEDALQSVASLLKSPTEEVSARVSALLLERKQARLEIEDLRKRLALSGASGGKGGTSSGADNDASSVRKIGEVNFTTTTLTGIPAKQLRSIAEESLSNLGSGVVAIFCEDEGKASVVIAVSKDLTSRFDAVELVQQAACVIGGKGGGGRPDMAQAGGNAPKAIPEAIEKLVQAIEAS